MNNETITPENLSKDLLKDVLDSALIENSFTSDGLLMVKESIKVWVNPDLDKRDRITLLSIFRLRPESSELQRLRAVNEMNTGLIIARAYINEESIVFDGQKICHYPPCGLQ
jgi:hypothetical protein